METSDVSLRSFGEWRGFAVPGWICLSGERSLLPMLVLTHRCFPVLSDAIIHNGLIHQHLQGLVVPNIMGEGGQLNSPTSITE